MRLVWRTFTGLWSVLSAIIGSTVLTLLLFAAAEAAFTGSADFVGAAILNFIAQH